MNGETYSSNIKSLKLNYIIHFILHGLTIIYNFILIIEIIWLKNLLYTIYYWICIFVILYFLIPIIPFVYLLLKKITKKYIKIFKRLSVTFCVLVLITGLSLTILLMVNTLESQDFCRECPFNLPDSYVNNIYSDYLSKIISENDLRDDCKNRICIFNNKILDSDYPYEYICNYNPEGEFDQIRNESNINQTIQQIICHKMDSDSNYNNFYFKEKNINYFFDMCNSIGEYYICQRMTEPKKYSFKDNFNCPKKTYLIKLFIFSLLSVILNLIVSFILWKIEYSKYKFIISSINRRNIREGNKSLNSTQNVSKIQKEKVEESFKKQPTETIIVYNETEDNMVTKINNNNDDGNDNTNNIDNNNDIDNSIDDNSNKKNIQINLNINREISFNNKINKNNNSININKNVSSKILNKIVQKSPKLATKKVKSEKLSSNEKIKNEENAIKIFKINDGSSKKKENKKAKEKKEMFVRSNSYKISYYSDRNILEESKSVPEM